MTTNPLRLAELNRTRLDYTEGVLSMKNAYPTFIAQAGKNFLVYVLDMDI